MEESFSLGTYSEEFVSLIVDMSTFGNGVIGLWWSAGCMSVSARAVDRSVSLCGMVGR